MPITNVDRETTGYVLYWNEVGSYGAIRTDGPRTYICLGKEIEPDEIGRRYLIPNETVLFTPSVSGDRWRATKVHPSNRGPVTVDEGYREECLVEQVHRGIAFFRRPFGGHLYFRIPYRGSLTRALVPGVRVIATPVPPKTKFAKLWDAADVQILPDTPERIPEVMQTQPETAMAAAFERMTVTQ